MNVKIPRARAITREPEVPFAAYSREVRGYHGCDREVADRLVSGEPFTPSSNEWDWLGDGIYFWEHGPDRAFRWAARQSRINHPAVVGALIQLGRCLDLLDTRFTSQLRAFYARWVWLLQLRGETLPENRGKGRYLDRSVIEEFLVRAREIGIVYDTVRSAFVEGEPIYPGSGFYTETHIQVAVRNPQCIVGVFRPAFLIQAEGANDE